MQGRKLFILLIVFQISVISLLIYKITSGNQNQSVLSVNSLEKEKYRRQDSVRNHYYDFVPDNVVRFSLNSQNIKNDYIINYDGLAENTDIQPDKPNNTFRIITLGDSFTFGLHVPQDQNFSKILERSLNNSCNKYANYEVINFGVPGYDLRFAGDKFIKKGLKYDPDVVFWWVGVRDIDTYDSEVKSLLEEYPPNSEGNSNTEKYNIYYNKIISGFKEKLGSDYFIEKNMETLIDVETKSKQIPKIIIGESGTIKILNEKINSDRHDIDTFNTLTLNPSLRSSPELSIKDDHHPTILGHTVISENIFKYLFSNFC